MYKWLCHVQCCGSSISSRLFISSLRLVVFCLMNIRPSDIQYVYSRPLYFSSASWFTNLVLYLVRFSVMKSLSGWFFKPFLLLYTLLRVLYEINLIMVPYERSSVTFVKIWLNTAFHCPVGINILFRFLSYRCREKVYNSKRNLKNDADKFFITEYLTKTRTNLVKDLADLKYNQNINTYWTMEGRI
jgi:hypothetical protein